ncbi:hypothetical protein BDY24DRAFT_375289 [Mrakia frigida]|uniref:uncharacterized protein n=1 Tax=Mrakia frigida TaxID=29902 RepID=UPI003FCC1417
MFRVPRRRTLGRLAAFGALLFILSTLLIPSSSLRPSSRRWDASKYVQGEWVPRPQPFTSWDDVVLEQPGALMHLQEDCYDWDGSKKKGDDGRRFAQASFDFVGKEGGRTSWDAREMVVDLLQRRGGLFMVGDSLTVHHFSGLSHLLLGLEVLESKRANLTTVTPNLLQRSPPNKGPILFSESLKLPKLAGIWLNPDHPLAQGLLDEAGVGVERTLRPLVLFTKEDFFLSREDFERLKKGGILTAFHGDDDYATDWLTYLERLGEGQDPSFEKETVVVFNTGPHWVQNRFLGPGWTDSPERLLALYEEGLNGFYERIHPYTTFLPILRSTHQGHPNCGMYLRNGPANETTMQAIRRSYFLPPLGTASPTLELWNWPYVPDMNTIVKTGLDTFNARRRKERRQEGMWMDVHRPTHLRPDAHARPFAGDCLHQCTPGVPEEWARFLWEIIKSSNYS